MRENGNNEHFQNFSFLVFSPEIKPSPIRELTLKMLAYKPENRLTASDIVEEFGDIRVTNYVIVIKCETSNIMIPYLFVFLDDRTLDKKKCKRCCSICVQNQTQV